MCDSPAVCAEVLAGLDEDIMEYVVGMLEDSIDEDEMGEQVSEFLLSSDFVEDEADAEAKSKALFAALREASGGDAGGGDGGGGDASGAAGAAGDDGDDDAPALLNAGAPVKIGAVKLESEESKGGDADADAKASKKGSAIKDAKALERQAKKDAKDAAAKAKKYEKARQQMMELEAELVAARETAVRLRQEQGAHLGAIEAAAFSLPNPGGGPDLIENASFNLVRGKRYALIGRNGKGKSTMLRWLASRRAGNFPSNVTVHYVTQDVTLRADQEASKPWEVVVEADVERRLLLQERDALMAAAESSSGAAAAAAAAAAGGGADEEDADQASKLQSVMERLEAIDAGRAQVRAEQLLSNLGFSDELQQRSMKALSGGWRVRVALAAAIFARPDVLLLDEPTNHLSIQAVLWLAHELTTSVTWQERIVIIVSHDRYFLDEVCMDTLHISGAARRLTQSHGSYTTWAKRRAEQQKALQRSQQLRQHEIDTLKEYAGHGFRYGGSASQINKMKMKEKQAEKLEEEASNELEELAALEEDQELPLELKGGSEIDGFICQLVGVGFRYPAAGGAGAAGAAGAGGVLAAAAGQGKSSDGDRPLLFSGAEFSVDSKSRIVLLGENGNGKTTLVKLMLGELEPTVGEVKRNLKARIAIVNQHHAEQINLTLTPLQFMQSKFPGDGSYGHDQVLRGHLSGCGVPHEQQMTPCSALSGGQRSRVAMAAVSFVRPHLLVMDEPTNSEFQTEGERGGVKKGERGRERERRRQHRGCGSAVLRLRLPPLTHQCFRLALLVCWSINLFVAFGQQPNPPSTHTPLIPLITKDLDLESVAALAECVQNYEGGVVLVSHDQFFVSKVANEVWVVADGTVKQATSFDAYRKKQLAKLGRRA